MPVTRQGLRAGRTEQRDVRGGERGERRRLLAASHCCEALLAAGATLAQQDDEEHERGDGAATIRCAPG